MGRDRGANTDKAIGCDSKDFGVCIIQDAKPVRSGSSRSCAKRPLAISTRTITRLYCCMQNNVLRSNRCGGKNVAIHIKLLLWSTSTDTEVTTRSAEVACG